MEALRQQVSLLTQQVDALYKLIENLNETLLQSANETKLADFSNSAKID